MKLLFILFFIFSIDSRAEKSIVAVGEASLEKHVLAINVDKNCQCDDLVKIIKSDFSFYKNVISLNSENAGATVLISRDAELAPIKVTYDGDVVSFNQDNGLRRQAHQISNFIYKKLIGRESIFNSKIVFISDQGINKLNQKSKQLFIADFDGFNSQQITSDVGHVLSPAISNDGKVVAYSLIKPEKKNKNVQLYIVDVETKKSTLVSNLKGINSGAVFLPGDKELVLTLTHSGNAEIYKLNLITKKIIPLTNHWAADVDPSVSPDGKKVAFLSSRPGKPMIYLMDLNGVEKGVKRVSFIGKFNATPRFSPNGRDIIFSSWLDQRFDLFRVSIDGNNLTRLTKDFGSNEDPTYSPDGELVAFTSQRIISEKKDVKNIYIMSKDGEILSQVTKDLGKCQSPRWSK